MIHYPNHGFDHPRYSINADMAFAADIALKSLDDLILADPIWLCR
jgi:hypothetical protein